MDDEEVEVVEGEGLVLPADFFFELGVQMCILHLRQAVASLSSFSIAKWLGPPSFIVHSLCVYPGHVSQTR